MVDIEVSVVLPELARRNLYTKAFAHFILRLCDTILVTFSGIIREQRGVELQRIVSLEICTI